jgi:hypothetical protein
MGRLIGQAFPTTAQAQELHNHKLCEVPAPEPAPKCRIPLRPREITQIGPRKPKLRQIRTALRQIAALQQYPCTIYATAHEYFINQPSRPSHWHLVYITLYSPEG